MIRAWLAFSLLLPLASLAGDDDYRASGVTVEKYESLFGFYKNKFDAPEFLALFSQLVEVAPKQRYLHREDSKTDLAEKLEELWLQSPADFKQLYQAARGADASAALDKLLKTPPDVNTLRDFIRDHRFTEAAQEAEISLGSLYLEMGNPKEAARFLRQAFRQQQNRDPKAKDLLTARTLFKLVLAEARSGRLAPNDPAIALLKNALQNGQRLLIGKKEYRWADVETELKRPWESVPPPKPRMWESELEELLVQRHSPDAKKAAEAIKELEPFRIHYAGPADWSCTETKQRFDKFAAWSGQVVAFSSSGDPVEMDPKSARIVSSEKKNEMATLYKDAWRQLQEADPPLADKHNVNLAEFQASTSGKFLLVHHDNSAEVFFPFRVEKGKATRVKLPEAVALASKFQAIESHLVPDSPYLVLQFLSRLRDEGGARPIMVYDLEKGSHVILGNQQGEEAYFVAPKGVAVRRTGGRDHYDLSGKKVFSEGQGAKANEDKMFASFKEDVLVVDLNRKQKRSILSHRDGSSTVLRIEDFSKTPPQASHTVVGKNCRVVTNNRFVIDIHNYYTNAPGGVVLQSGANGPSSGSVLLRCKDTESTDKLFVLHLGDEKPSPGFIGTFPAYKVANGYQHFFLDPSGSFLLTFPGHPDGRKGFFVCSTPLPKGAVESEIVRRNRWASATEAPTEPKAKDAHAPQ